MAVWNLFFSSILIPLVAIALLWRRPRKPVVSWAVTFFMALGLAGFSFLVAPWGWFGVPVRWMILGLFIGATVASLNPFGARAGRAGPARREEGDPDEAGDGAPGRRALPDESPMRLVVKILIGFFFGSVALGALQGRRVPSPPHDLGTPLQAGRYLVFHGGSTPQSNIHHQDEKQRYAVDFVKLNRFGRRARGVMPADPRSYEIFGARVVSPCDGVVARSAGGQPDGGPMPSGQGPQPDPLGNHVVIRCGDTDVTMAHLQLGSIGVKPGARVARGAPLARAGHSGASPEPHLHVHAERGGVGVPVTFDGRWLVRNATVQLD